MRPDGAALARNLCRPGNLELAAFFQAWVRFNQHAGAVALPVTVEMAIRACDGASGHLLGGRNNLACLELLTNPAAPVLSLLRTVRETIEMIAIKNHTAVLVIHVRTGIHLFGLELVAILRQLDAIAADTVA